MTLAEIRDEVERHLAVAALAGVSRSAGDASALRVLAALLRAHLRPRATLCWYGEPWLLERYERGDLIFHRPRAVIRLTDFLAALRRGGVRDAPSPTESVTCRCGSAATARARPRTGRGVTPSRKLAATPAPVGK